MREGLEVGKYFMFDAAVPSEAIDSAMRAERSADDAYLKYVRPEWQDYTNACWASNWHRLFADDQSDSRGRMGWPDRFADALSNASDVYNYYSSGDAVFSETDEVPSLLTGATHWGIDWYLWILPFPTVEVTFDNHCWQKQEVLKGMATVAGTLSGGWGFNTWLEYDSESQDFKTVSYSPEGAAAAVADHSITNRPAFDVSDALEMKNPSASDDDVFLALAKHVPALSSAVGGVPVLGNLKDYDLNDGNYRNGWGRDEDSYYGVNWLHSDMKDMAYIHVFKLYDEIVLRKGDLK